MLNAKRVDKHLVPGRPGGMYCFDTVVSTNVVAEALVAAGEAADGDAVAADSQTRGSGRLGREFYSPPGLGVYLSYIKKIPDAAGSPGFITSLAGLAVVAALEKCFGLKALIKWPNDIVIKNKKICGILTRLCAGGADGKTPYAVIGIGVNVNQTPGDFPPELAAKAGSVRIALGQVAERERLLAEIVNELDMIMLYQNALCQPAAPYIGQLKELSFTLGKKITVSSQTKKETAVALDLAPDGALVIQTLEGKKTIRSGEIDEENGWSVIG